MVDMADSGNSIREKAEKKLARSKRGPADSKTLTEDEILHELHVHQFELEIQNETLRESQVALQESRDQYSNLYDYAPVGYLSLDENTNIIKGNLTHQLPVREVRF